MPLSVSVPNKVMILLLSDVDGQQANDFVSRVALP